MKIKKKIGKYFTLALLLFFSFNILSEQKQDDDRLIKNREVSKLINKFSSFESRVTGYPGCDLAADFLVEEFGKIGLKDIKSLEYDIAVPLEGTSVLKIKETNKEYKINCFWPNLARTPSTSPSGITGSINYVKSGETHEFNGKTIKDSIVLMDYNCKGNWENAFIFGAKAIIFIKPKNATRYDSEDKVLMIPANLPRYYIDSKSAAEIIKSKEQLTGNIKAKMVWKAKKGRNIIGFIEGSDPVLKDECIIINSFYDSMSSVPAVSPGAEDASGITGLLEIAKVLQKGKPKRSIAFLATSGHFTAMAGIRYFVKQYMNNNEESKAEYLRENPKGKKPVNIFQEYKQTIFISLNLSSGNKNLGILFSGNYYGINDSFTIQFQSFEEELIKSDESGSILPLTKAKKGLNWGTYFPVKIACEHEPVILNNNYAASIVTLNDPRIYNNSPTDIAKNVNVNNLSIQIEVLSKFFKKLSGSDIQYEIKSINESKNYSKEITSGYYGQVVEFDPSISFVPNKPVPNALVFLKRDLLRESIGGVRQAFTVQTDSSGYFYFPCVPCISGSISGEYQIFNNKRAGVFTYNTIDAFVVSEWSGEITYAKDLGARGEAKFPVTVISHARRSNYLKTCVVFKAQSTILFDMIDPRNIIQPEMITVLDAQTDSVPLRYASYSYKPVKTAVFFGDENARFKFTFQSGIAGSKSFLIGSVKDHAEGTGISLKSNPMFTHTPIHIASDEWNLNEARIINMKKYGIFNERLNELHIYAKKTIEKAFDALENLKYDEFLRYSREAWGYEAKAYPDVLGTITDVIKGILFYMILVLPFVFFAERLIFGSTDLKKQILATFGIFILVFVILSAVHPAFNLSNSPYIILLGFIIFMLAVMVISIIYNRFKSFTNETKAAVTGIHSVDVSRVTTTATAFRLGISNIKKRPGRAVLTSSTLILITFAALSFTSVKTFVRYNSYDLDNKPSYEGLLFRDKNWKSLDPSAYKYIKNIFSKTTKAAPRSWYIHSNPSREKRYIDILNGESIYTVNAFLGLTDKDKDFLISKGAIKAGGWLKENSLYTCLIPAEAAKKLKIKEQDLGTAHVKIFDISFTVSGIYDEKKVDQIKDLDNESFMPVDFSSADAASVSSVNVGDDVSFPSYYHMLPQSAIIVPYELPLILGGDTRAVRVEFAKNSEVSIKDEIEKLMPRLSFTVFAGIENKTRLFSTNSGTSFSGLSNILIPIIIAALIVLNTMLGSVYERLREIGIYSSVGLAPSHIAMLFIAEACVYATVGAITGYLFGQTLAKFVSDTGLLKGLSLNYSSLAAVGACGIVTLTVILSSLYPAFKASKMAVPDVSRRWKQPKAEGDDLDFELPFTVNIKDSIAINSFLAAYLRSHTETAIGKFYSDNIKMNVFDSKYGRAFRIETKIWIFPLELGVSQNMIIETVPIEDPGVFEVKFLIKRLSGETTTWNRMNRGFLDGIRKQFLTWRTVDETLKKRLNDDGVKEFGI